MAQARRIKKKPAKKAKKNNFVWNIPWGLILVVLGSCVVIALLFHGAKNGDSQFGAGLKEILRDFEAEPDENAEIAELIELKSSKKEYDFYTLLPDIEKVMPDDLPDSQPVSAPQDVDYYLQAASFRERIDAEKLRARLTLKNYQAVTQAREVEGQGTYYRVRLGPYADKRKAKTAKNKLQKLGVRPFIFSVQKN
jgi:hypothetical protein